MNIICPICKEKLFKNEKVWCCANNHSFDIAKEGYINLDITNSSKESGDNKEMVRARTDFLGADYYKFLKDRINELILEYKPNNLVDLACGEGYYTKDFDCLDKLGVDLSKEAIKYASKHDKDSLYVVSSIFKLPIEDNSIDMALTIFAPVAKDEIKRILKDGGYFILVKPDINHLFELKNVVYDIPYLNEIEDIEIDGLELINEIHINNHHLLKNEEIINLFKMTPYYHKTSKSDFEKLYKINELDVNFEFIIDVYKKLV